MSSSYDPSVDRGALRRRAAEIGRRRLGTQPLSPDLATRRTGLKRSDDQAVAARRRLARCYAALQASPRRPDWDALTRLARGAEAAAAAARPSIDGESPAALRREARFVAAHIGLAEALYRCDLGATASALVSATKARAALCGEGAESPSLKAAQQFCSAAYAAHLSKIPILFDVDCAAAALRSVKERSESCHVELVEADATTLAPFVDATFDVVVDKGTVDALISGDAAAATEACAAAGRVLKRGGRFVVVSHRRPDGDDAWLEAVLAGLSEVDAAWRVDAHASAGPAVYVFTKRRSACREVELVVHEYG